MNRPVNRVLATDPENDSPGGRDSTLDVSPSRYGASELVARLRTAIVQKKFSDGDRLPAERELAAQFGKSRGTARHALRELERLNLVTRRVGSGTFVKSPGLDNPDEVAEVTSPLELLQVRFAIEPLMVRHAIMNASPRHLAKMQERLEELEKTDDPAKFTEADKEFHLALAECSQNPLIIWLYRQINEVRSHTQWALVKEKILTPSRIRQYNQHHRDLYTAISTRDTSRALDVINQHLGMAKDDLLGAQV